MTFLKNKKILWIGFAGIIILSLTGTATYQGLNLNFTRDLNSITSKKLEYAKNNIKILETDNAKLKDKSAKIEKEITSVNSELSLEREKIIEINKKLDEVTKLKNEYINISNTLSNEKIQANLKIENLEKTLTNKDKIISDLTLNINKNEEEINTLLSELNHFKIETLNYIDQVLRLSNENITNFERIRELDTINSDFYSRILTQMHQFVNFLNSYRDEISKIEINIENSKYLNETIKLFYSQITKNIHIIDSYKNSLFEYISNKLINEKNKVTELEASILFKEDLIDKLEKEKTSNLEKIDELTNKINSLETLINNKDIEIKNKNEIIENMKRTISIQLENFHRYAINLLKDINIDNSEIRDLIEKTELNIANSFNLLSDSEFTNEVISGRNYKIYSDFIHASSVYTTIFSDVS
ncbi:hypothetical protein C4M83_03480, partial [Mycoplasmopsis pullorum]